MSFTCDDPTRRNKPATQADIDAYLASRLDEERVAVGLLTVAEQQAFDEESEDELRRLHLEQDAAEAAEDDWIDSHDDWCDSDADEVECDVCQHCGGYFAWTKGLREAWERTWKPGPNDTQPQRCHRCIVDECWIERRDEAKESAQ
jgi:hypothetical protein